MPNMSPNKVKMPEQDPNVRNKNFEEVSLGYTKEQAMEEATRCLNCKKPFCMDGCPVGVPSLSNNYKRKCITCNLWTCLSSRKSM